MIGLRQLENKKVAILICAGEMPSPTFLGDVLKTLCYTKLYCADGGAKYLYQSEFVPDVIIGDLDSLDKEIQDYFRVKDVSFLAFPPEKNFSDTELAIRTLVEENETDIILLGAMGGRMDHHLANLFLLDYFAKKGVRLYLLDEHNYITYLLEGEYKIKKENGYLSFFTSSQMGMCLSLSGVKYPLKNREVHFGSSLCLSNEFIEDVAKVEVVKGNSFLIISEENR